MSHMLAFYPYIIETLHYFDDCNNVVLNYLGISFCNLEDAVSLQVRVDDIDQHSLLALHYF